MRIIPIVGALLLASSVAMAQQKPANPDANTPAVSTPNTTNPNAPVEGANSFTEGQARSRIEAAGFTKVTNLTKDPKGVWRGRAMKGGAQVAVSLDFQGNVTAN
jgi:hypothetical protein